MQRLAPRRAARGFTLVEVMVALGVMTVGAMAIIGMQQQTTRANVHARDLTIAMQIAQNLLERMKLEAVAWNTVNPSNPAGDLVNAPSLARITGSTPGSFMPIVTQVFTNGTITKTLANAFNYAGEDVNLAGANAETQATVHFCAGYRLSWVQDNWRAMRVDVRVWWTKEYPGRSIITDFPGCADTGAIDPGGALYNNYHVVYLSTVIRAVSSAAASN